MIKISSIYRPEAKCGINRIRSSIIKERITSKTAKIKKQMLPKIKDSFNNETLEPWEAYFAQRKKQDPMLFNDNVITAYCNLEKMPILKNLSNDEIDKFRRELLEWNPHVFFATIAGCKPASINWAENSVEYLNKIKKDPIFAENYNLLWCDENYTTFFLFNKKETLKTISRNKEIYTSRLNLEKNTSVEEIYNIITEPSKNILFNSFAYEDLLGITLGYPKNSSLLYVLESSIDKDGFLINYRTKHKRKYFIKMLATLYSPNSILQNLDTKAKTELEHNIRSTKSQRFSGYNLYTFVNFLDEPLEHYRILQAEKKYINSAPTELLGINSKT